MLAYLARIMDCDEGGEGREKGWRREREEVVLKAREILGKKYRPPSPVEIQKWQEQWRTFIG